MGTAHEKEKFLKRMIDLGWVRTSPPKALSINKVDGSACRFDNIVIDDPCPDIIGKLPPGHTKKYRGKHHMVTKIGFNPVGGDIKGR